MNVAQETLGFRRAGLSPALSLLMSAFALPIPPAGFTAHLHRPTERSPTVSGTRIQKTEVRNRFRYSQLLYKACSILAIAWYSSRHRCHLASSICSRSKQYRDQTRISSADPMAICKNRLNSAFTQMDPTEVSAQRTEARATAISDFCYLTSDS
jgi:hypothetical protein